ncbi:unnamed protein product [Camellia sinensis]
MNQEESLPLIRIPLAKLIQQAWLEGNPSIHVYGGERSWCQLSQLVQNISKKWRNSGRLPKKAIPAKNSADRQHIMPTGNTVCRPANKIADGRKRPAGGLQPLPVVYGGVSQGIPCPSKAKQKCSVQNRTPHGQVRSKRTQSWMITECSNGDVQVLRTVKNGVSTVAEAELAEKTEQLQEGVVESGVVVTPTKPKKCKAALPLKSDRGKWGQGMWEVTPEMEALKLAPCAMAAQDEKSDVPNNICQQVKKLGQNPGCLCAVMLSDTASIRRALQVLHCVEDGIIVHEQPLFYEEPDVHENMRLSVDDMSYEELLALEDQIGNVSTGLSEEAILAAVRRHCYLSMKLGPPVEEEPCCICQEDYVDGKELGKLNCGHEIHFNCIKQWLVRRITVPFEKRLQWLFERSSVSGNSYPKSEIICQSVVPVNFSPVPSPSELIPSACHFLF